MRHPVNTEFFSHYFEYGTKMKVSFEILPPLMTDDSKSPFLEWSIPLFQYFMSFHIIYCCSKPSFFFRESGIEGGSGRGIPKYTYQSKIKIVIHA